MWYCLISLSRQPHIDRMPMFYLNNSLRSWNGNNCFPLILISTSIVYLRVQKCVWFFLFIQWLSGSWNYQTQFPLLFPIVKRSSSSIIMLRRVPLRKQNCVILEDNIFKFGSRYWVWYPIKNILVYFKFKQVHNYSDIISYKTRNQITFSILF